MMRITCPSCGTAYEVAEEAVGPQGRKVRCRACGASWVEPSRISPARTEAAVSPDAPPAPATAVAPAIPSSPFEPVVIAAPPAPEAIVEEAAAAADPSPRRRWLRAPLLALLLVIAALALGIAIASLVWGPQQLASEFGLAGRRVPLGIAITKEPDWREIAGGSELFAVSGRIWNPTQETQAVPDVLAEIKDKKGRTLREWRIARPAKALTPGAHIDFDGASVDVPRESATVALSFVGEKK